MPLVSTLFTLLPHLVPGCLPRAPVGLGGLPLLRQFSLRLLAPQVGHAERMAQEAKRDGCGGLGPVARGQQLCSSGGREECVGERQQEVGTESGSGTKSATAVVVLGPSRGDSSSATAAREAGEGEVWGKEWG